MPQRSKSKVPDELYSVVVVTLQIRILDEEITRSRVSANIYPDEALAQIATEKLQEDRWGRNERDELVVNLSDHWLDVNGSYPKFDEGDPSTKYEEMPAMNAHIKTSVQWVFDLHKKARGYS